MRNEDGIVSMDLVCGVCGKVETFHADSMKSLTYQINGSPWTFPGLILLHLHDVTACCETCRYMIPQEVVLDSLRTLETSIHNWLDTKRAERERLGK